jgi:HEAT repeat protein
MVKRGWLIVLLAFMVMPAVSTFMPVGTGTCVIAQGVDQETETLFTEAIDLYKRGRDGEALEKLKLVLAKDPSHEEAFLLRDKVAFALWIDLMTKRGEHRAVINEFLRRASVGDREKRKDDEAVTKLLEQVRTGDYSAQRAAAQKIEMEHGDFAVPAIVAAIAQTSNDDYRNELIQLLRQLGPEATLPLVECLKSDDLALKRYAVIALSLVKDDRSAAALKGIMEKPNDEALIKAAERARRNLGLSEAMLAKAAKEIFVDMAAKYYRRTPGVMKEFSANRVVWEWKDGKLNFFEVPLYLYHLYIAEKACYDALTVDPNFRDAQVWLARIHLAQIEELSSAAARGSDEAKALAEKMAKARFLAASAGVDCLEEAVRVCITDKDLAVAEAGIFLLGDLLTGPTFQGGVLADALTSQHKLVRYAAAIVVGNLVPSGDFANSDRVASELSYCIAESTMRTILVIDDVVDTRNRLLSELRELGYFATGAHNGAMGVLLAKRPPTPDLVILRTTLSSGDATISTQGVLSEIKGDVRTQETPVLGLTASERADTDKDLLGDKIVEIVKIPLVKDSYAGTIKDALRDRNPNQQKALMYAEKAAQALAKLAMANKFNPQAALGNLIATLSEKPENVKLPAIKALGGIGDPSALIPLKDTFNSEGQPADVRAAAAVAIGQICRTTGNIPVDVFQALLEGLGADDLTVSQGAGKGLGIAPLTAAQRTEVLTRHRITLDSLFQK